MAADADAGVEPKANRTLRVGTDLVIFKGERVLIIARAAMNDWEVRQHRHALIHFDERRWRILTRAAFEGGTVHYELEPWDPGEHEDPGVEIHYDANYVAARDRALDVHRKHARVSVLFIGFAPFTGFLSGPIKAKIEHKYGIDSVSSTWHSIILEGIVALMSMALASIGMISGSFPGLVLIPVAAALAADGMIRWERILGEQRPPPGFYEWLFRPERHT